jgi:hypothetical protein
MTGLDADETTAKERNELAEGKDGGAPLVNILDTDEEVTVDDPVGGVDHEVFIFSLSLSSFFGFQIFEFYFQCKAFYFLLNHKRK